MPDDVLTGVKRQQEVADRPSKTAPTPVPPGLHEFSGVSYKAAAPKKEKEKSDIDKSLEWNVRQQKIAESSN
jgi:hypothetical protein